MEVRHRLLLALQQSVLLNVLLLVEQPKMAKVEHLQALRHQHQQFRVGGHIFTRRVILEALQRSQTRLLASWFRPQEWAEVA